MSYEIPKYEIAMNHDLYVYLCGGEDLATAIQECYASNSKGVKLRFQLEDWEEEGDKITINYKRKDTVQWFDGVCHVTEKLCKDIVETAEVFNDPMGYGWLLTPVVPTSLSKEGWRAAIEEKLALLESQIAELRSRHNDRNKKHVGDASEIQKALNQLMK